MLKAYLRLILPSIGLMFALSGCFGSSSPSPEEEAPPKELNYAKSEGGFDANTPEEELFNRGKRLLASGTYAIAKDAFELVLTNYPGGPYSEFAELKLADIDFIRAEYLSAAGRYDSFVTAHPASEAADYAIYRAAESYRKANRGVGRDPAPLEKSLATAEKLLALYPQSAYASAAKKLRSEVVELLAAQEQFISEFYRQQGMTRAAEARLTTVEKYWKPIIDKAAGSSAGPAVPRGLSSPAAKPLNVPKAVVAARLGAVTTKTAAPLASRPQNVIEQIHCEGSVVTLSLNNNLAEQLPLLVTKDGVTLKVPHARLSDLLNQRLVRPCFASDDMKLSGDGTVYLQTARHAEVMSLDYPPRLLLVLK